MAAMTGTNLRRTFLMLQMFLICNTSAEFGQSEEKCPTKKEIPSCKSISTVNGYTYHVLPSISACLNMDCEHGWNLQNGTFVVDSTPDGNGKKLEFVVAVTPQNLTVSTCMNLQWHIECEGSQCNCIVNYTVLEQDTSRNDPPEDKQGLSHWAIALIVLAIVGITAASAIYGASAIWRWCKNSGNRTHYNVAGQSVQV